MRAGQKHLVDERMHLSIAGIPSCPQGELGECASRHDTPGLAGPPLIEETEKPATIRATALIVEDDPALSELLQWHFESNGFEVRTTGDGEEALLLVQEQLPDIIMLDWQIERLSGLEVCRQLRRSPKSADVPIIMLTARSHEDDRIRGLKTGADDYMTKPFSPRELLARVEALLRRRRPALVGEKLRMDDLELDAASHRVYRGGREVHLGPTEFRLLLHFMERPGRVLSRQQLIDSVWEMDRDVDERTVDVYILRLRRAMTVPGVPDIIKTVRSAGYSLNLG